MARAWPPLEESSIAGWRLRFAGGVTKRANSVLPLASEEATDLGDRSLTARIVAAEKAYGERSLPSRFQLTRSSWPPALADALVRRGYVESDRTLVMTTSLATKASPLAASGWDLVEQAAPSPAWLDTWWVADGRGGAPEREIARAILGQIELPCMFVECHDSEGVAAVAMGVLDDAWVGLYCMATLPRARRRGCARALAGRLMAGAKAQGAIHAHLAVTETNEPSRRLSGTFGFKVRQLYSYYTLAT